jgi:hypothetical protein
MQRSLQVLFLLLTLQFFVSCRTPKKYTLATYRNSQQDGDYFSDSLLRSGIDTLISYCDCGGYMGGLSRPYYIFWVWKGKGYLTKLDNYSNYNIQEAYFGFNFIIALEDTITKTVLKRPNYNLSHDSYDKLKIKIGKFNYDIGLEGRIRSHNILSYPDIIIDKFRSFLLYREAYWRGLSYKYEKKTSRKGIRKLMPVPH